MKKTLLSILVFVAIIFGYVFAQSTSHGELSLKIIWNGLIIGTPANLSLWTVSPWTTVQKTFDDYFWLEDLRGISTGHYTTIQCDGLYGPNGYVITWVQMIWPNVVLIGWLTNQTTIYSNLSSRTDVTTPQLYLYRNNNIDTSTLGFTNRYGNKPSIKVSIPSNAPVGSYKWKITYTLYDMDFNYSN